MRLWFWVLGLLLSAAIHAPAFAASEGILAEVTNGSATVQNAVVEQTVDLAGAAGILGGSNTVNPGAVRVVEIDEKGAEQRMLVSQVDPAEGAGKYVVCWQVPGEWQPGITRKFLVLLNDTRPVPIPASPISVAKMPDGVVVTSGDIALTFQQGLPTKAVIGGVSGSFRLGDYTYETRHYTLANPQATVLASGPLRFSCRTQCDFASEGKPAPGNVRIAYTFTQYAGEPVTRVQYVLKQDMVHQNITSPLEVYFAGSPVDSFYAESPTNDGKLRKDAQNYQSSKVVAAYGNSFLLGVYSPSGPLIYDGGPEHAPYIKAGHFVWSAQTYSSSGGLIWGHGPSDLASLEKWANTGLASYQTSLKLTALDSRLAQVQSMLERKSSSLSNRTGSKWAGAYVDYHISSISYSEAVEKARRGDFTAAGSMLEQAKSRLSASKSDVTAVTRGRVVSGISGGYPFLANDTAIYIWSRPEDGCGLIGIYDRISKHEYLVVNPTRATLWQFSTKGSGGGRSYSSLGSRCRAVPVPGGIDFLWIGSARVGVSARLKPDEPLARMRLRIKLNSDGESLQVVEFPAIKGIAPISDRGGADQMLNTWACGDLAESPMVAGRPLTMSYPNCMQFTGFYAKGIGLYVAEEDPNACQKDFVWRRGDQEAALEYSVTHPVLNWASTTKLVSRYDSPGDIMIGPFKGDWFDAAQIYRKWAVRAPWCSKGPILARKDYPRWVADAPFWTIGHTQNEDSIDNLVRQAKYFGQPSGIFHDYGLFQFGDDAGEYYPRLGSIGARKTAGKLHSLGWKLVAFTDGILHAPDTEGFINANMAQTASRTRADGSVVYDTCHALPSTTGTVNCW